MKQAEEPQIQKIQLHTWSSIREEDHEYVHEYAHEETPEEEDVETKNFQEIDELSQPSLRKSTQVKTFPKMYDDFVTFVALITNDDEPSCYQEAMKVFESSKCKLTMKEEMDSFEKNKTWDLVEVLNDIKFVGCKCIYKMKKAVDEKVANQK